MSGAFDRLVLVLVVVIGLVARHCDAWSDGEPVPLLVAFRDGDTVTRPEALPHALLPRFGVDRVVDLAAPAKRGFQQIWDAKIQFELGGNMRRKTTWMVLQTPPRFSRFESASHSGKHLVEVQIRFGFERHVVGRVTGFKYSAVYAATVNKTDGRGMRLRYTWHATHDYDTRLALTATYALCAGVFVYLLYVITASGSGIQGTQKLVVRDRKQ
jgi:hypothetical protein